VFIKKAKVSVVVRLEQEAIYIVIVGWYAPMTRSRGLSKVKGTSHEKKQQVCKLVSKM